MTDPNVSSSPDSVPPQQDQQSVPPQPFPTVPEVNAPAPFPGAQYPPAVYPGAPQSAFEPNGLVSNAVPPAVGVPGGYNLGAAESSAFEQPVQVNERVGLGLLLSLIGVVAGIALTVVIWNLGFVAAISGFVLAAAAIWLYSKGAGTPPRKGMVPVVLLVVVGLLLSAVLCVVVDGVQVIKELYPGTSLGEALDATFQIISADPGLVFKEYIGSLGLLLLFGALGIFGTLRGTILQGKNKKN